MHPAYPPIPNQLLPFPISTPYGPLLHTIMGGGPMQSCHPAQIPGQPFDKHREYREYYRNSFFPFNNEQLRDLMSQIDM